MYAITLFMCGSVVREWKDKNWQEKIAYQLHKYFKCKEMLEPVEVLYKNWEDEPSIDGSVWYLPPGVLTQKNDWKKPNGRIHWSGT